MGAMNLVFLVKTIFECLEEDDSVRTCDLKPSQTTIILIGSAITSAASLAYKLAHVEVSDFPCRAASASDSPHSATLGVATGWRACFLRS
jgi:hypothetical protein